MLTDTTEASSKQDSLLKRTLRFGLTGLFVTGLHFAIATLFVNYVQHNPSLANGVAFCIATIVSYLMHTLWSFSAKLHGKTLIRFVMVSMFGLCLSLTIPWIVQQLGFGYIVGTAAVVLILPVVNFALHNFWTYK